MSDVFDFVDTLPADVPGDFMPDFSSLPDIIGPDLSASGFSAGGGFTFPDFFANALQAGPSLPTPAGSGITGLLSDVTRLATQVFSADAQITAAQQAANIAKARGANQLATIKTAPNVWLVLGIAAAGIFALEVMDRQK